MSKLCPKCKSCKMEFVGSSLRGPYGAECIEYWCEKCLLVLLVRPKETMWENEDFR